MNEKLETGAHIHFIGVGGTGLSALARVAHEMGYRVTGSDLVIGPLAQALIESGIEVREGHEAGNVIGADLVVASSAIPADNVEVKAALDAGIPVLRRNGFLPMLLRGKKVIAVAGTHGKTTTTAMMAYVLTRAGLDPGYVIGGVPRDMEANARAGGGELFVIEADEYDHMFLGLEPYLAVITCIEHDHPDMFPTLEDVQSEFAKFVLKIVEGGVLVAGADSLPALQLAQAWRLSGKKAALYGIESQAAEWRATDLALNRDGGYDFLVVRGKELQGSARLIVPGRHNVLNALAIFAATDALGIPFNLVEEALSTFSGVGRRFEIKGRANDVVVIDDYAHHPTAIRATLSAVRDRFPEARVWAVFQPHTYSRLKALMDDFAGALSGADRVLVTPVYAARERDTLGVTPEQLVERLGEKALCVETFTGAVNHLLANVAPGDVVITLTAGDAGKIGEELLETLHVMAESMPAPEPIEAELPDGYTDSFADAFDEEAALIAQYGDIPKEAMRRLRKLARERKIPITPELVERVINGLKAEGEEDNESDAGAGD